MPLYEFEGKRPQVHPDAFIAPTAVLIGDVTVEAGASVWYGAVLRADICTIVVREDANIQDNSVLHGAPDTTVTIGRGATVAHGVVFHGELLGDKALVGNGSTVLDNARIGAGSLVAAGSMVAAETEIPEKVLALGSPAQVKKPITGTPAEFWAEMNGPYYKELGERHAAGVTPLD
jgi:carbonic anhydrase/acetyltransferase-like protein (isoleucine patch superfamily)